MSVHSRSVSACSHGVLESERSRRPNKDSIHSGLNRAPVLNRRPRRRPRSLALRRASSGHPRGGVSAAAGSGRGAGEQLGQGEAADEGRPLPVCC